MQFFLYNICGLLKQNGVNNRHHYFIKDMVTSQGPCGEHVHQFEMFAILQYVALLAVTLLLGNRHFHSKHFVSHSLGVVLILAPESEVDVTTRNGVIAHFI